MELRSHVQEILVEGGKAVGVRLRSGAEVRARKAVVSNASVWDTIRSSSTSNRVAYGSKRACRWSDTLYFPPLRITREPPPLFGAWIVSTRFYSSAFVRLFCLFIYLGGVRGVFRVRRGGGLGYFFFTRGTLSTRNDIILYSKQGLWID